MSSGYGPEPTTDRGRRIGTVIVWALTGVVLVFVAIGSIGMALDSSHKINPKDCEYVLESKRDARYLKCEVPDNFEVPNWPHKEAPLNNG